MRAQNVGHGPLVRLALVMVTALALLLGAAVPAFAGSASEERSAGYRYVALGDSYAAGRGAGSYLDGCLHTRASYPRLLDRLKGITLTRDASCNGATTADVMNLQISALTARTSLVTLTVGGNDLNTAAIAGACVVDPSSAQCQTLLAQAQALLTSGALVGRLINTYAVIAAAAPRARIVVTGYPYLFETPGSADPRLPIISALNSATAALNSVINGAVLKVQSAGADIHYVDVTAAFARHGILGAHPWINASGADAFHPTARGYAAYAAAVRAAIPGRLCNNDREVLTPR
jgi:lysophospholipase L1-like esterase